MAPQISFANTFHSREQEPQALTKKKIFVAKSDKSKVYRNKLKYKRNFFIQKITRTLM
jgi:hypothetical protein